MAYWISDGVSQDGPYPLDELPLHGLRAESLVWTEGMPQWQRADQVEAVAALLRSSPAAWRHRPPGIHPTAAPSDAVDTPVASPLSPLDEGSSSAYQQSPWPHTQRTLAYQSSLPPVGNFPLPQGMAVASLVLGILSLVFLLVYCAGVVPAILAVVFGHVSLSRVRAGTESGRGMALAGLICGYISLGLTASMVIVLVLFFLAAGL